MNAHRQKRTAVITFVAGFLGAATVAAAPTPNDHSLLSDAQKRSRKGDHVGAARLLTDARAADPKNAEVLSELGWQLFLAHDLPRALEATNQALAASTTSGGKAAALYNLGRIDEAMGQQEEAIKSYIRSLAQRPNNRTVLARLTTLDPKKGAELDPNRPRYLDGPFPSVAAWCAQLSDAKCDSSESEAAALIKGAHEVKAPQTPYRAVRVFVVSKSDDSTEGDCAIAIQVASGWYARRVVEDCREGGTFRNPVTHKLEVTALPGAANPVVRWRLQIDVAERNAHMEWMDKEPELHVVTCGIGSSNKPSCGEPYSEGPISFP